MWLVERKEKQKYKNISKALWIAEVTVRKYFNKKHTLSNTATERKIAQYLDKVHNEEIKGIIK